MIATLKNGLITPNGERTLVEALIKPRVKRVKKSLTPETVISSLIVKVRCYFDLGGLRKHVERRDRFDDELILQLSQIARECRRIA